MYYVTFINTKVPLVKHFPEKLEAIFLPENVTLKKKYKFDCKTNTIFASLKFSGVEQSGTKSRGLRG